MKEKSGDVCMCYIGHIQPCFVCVLCLCVAVFVSLSERVRLCVCACHFVGSGEKIIVLSVYAPSHDVYSIFSLCATARCFSLRDVDIHRTSAAVGCIVPSVNDPCRSLELFLCCMDSLASVDPCLRRRSHEPGGQVLYIPSHGVGRGCLG